MFRMVLMTQWKWSRLVLCAATIAAFAVPIISVQFFGDADGRWIDGRRVLQVMRAFGAWYAVLAAAAGLAVAMTAWSADHRGRHIYALTLPIPRWRLVLLRFGAGATLLTLPVVALWAGALLATSSVDIPPGLEALPTALAIRFALASLVAFGIFFAISAGTARTAGWVLGAIGTVFLLAAFGESFGLPDRVMEEIHGLIFSWPIVLEVFYGSWMLIDV